MEEMHRVEILAVFLSIKALIESGNIEKALEVLDKVIREAEKSPTK